MLQRDEPDSRRRSPVIANSNPEQRSHGAGSHRPGPVDRPTPARVLAEQERSTAGSTARLSLVAGPVDSWGRMTLRRVDLQRFLRIGATAAGLALLAPAVPVSASPPLSAPSLAVVKDPETVTDGAPRASRRACADVTFRGVADLRLKGIRTTGVSCSTARRVVRGARLHERWRSLGFACKVTGYDPEVATFYRCANGPGRVITFRAG
jgi:hypothetical protein